MRPFLILPAALIVVLSASAADPEAGQATRKRAGQEAASEEVARETVRRRGRVLISERNCVACHAASEESPRQLAPKQAPRLDAVGARVAPAYLRRFLLDPRGTRPGTTMPHVIGATVADEEAVESLVHFLVSLGGPFDGTPHGVGASEIERGRVLFHRVGCVACHLPQEELWELELPLEEVDRLRAEESVDTEEPEDVEGDVDENEPYVLPGVLPPRDLSLEHLAAKTSAEQLTHFLLDPLHVRPSGNMPSLGLVETEARSIALYLLRDQLDRQALERTAGLLAERYLGEFWGTVDLGAREPVDAVVTPTFSIEEREADDQFGFRFTGLLEVPTEGSWTFHTTSDDGSRLWVASELVVDNWGAHPPQERRGTIELTPGRHPVEVHFFEAGGGEELSVEWQGPGVERQEIPAAALSHVGLRFAPPSSSFELDARRVEEGGVLFEKLGCVTCHATGHAWDLGSPGAGAPGLVELSIDGTGPCVGSDPAARWRFEDEDLVALRAALAPTRSDPDHARALHVLDHMERLGCVYCHRRDEVGGVHPWNRDYFRAVEGTDIGDEGRIPPDLSGVGAKLRLPILEGALAGEGAVRPYMTTRMPVFGDANVGWMAAALDEVDPDLPFQRRVPPTGETLRQAGRLVGTKGGLGCIQCHDFAGTPSLGIRAVDLARMYERLEPGWFRAMLLDPPSVNMGTRMATLWDEGRSPVRDVYDGDPERQVDAIWHLLSLGPDMPRPIGLEAGDAAFELVPQEGPLACGVFMRDLSPRTVVVGFPELVHYAYDVEHGRLGKLWRGRFFNARGTWQGRAGELELPPTADEQPLPEGMPLVVLAEPDAPWPDAVGADAGVRPWRRTFTPDDTPTWWNRWGDRVIAETLAPRDGDDLLERVFEVWSPRADEALWLRVDPVWEGVASGPDGTELRFGGRYGFPVDAHPDRLRVLDGPDGKEYRVRLIATGDPDGAPATGLDHVYRVQLELHR